MGAAGGGWARRPGGGCCRERAFSRAKLRVVEGTEFFIVRPEHTVRYRKGMPSGRYPARSGGSRSCASAP